MLVRPDGARLPLSAQWRRVKSAALSVPIIERDHSPGIEKSVLSMAWLEALRGASLPLLRERQ